LKTGELFAHVGSNPTSSANQKGGSSIIQGSKEHYLGLMILTGLELGRRAKKGDEKAEEMIPVISRALVDQFLETPEGEEIVGELTEIRRDRGSSS
jgi:hypothetical protein